MHSFMQKRILMFRYIYPLLTVLFALNMPVKAQNNVFQHGEVLKYEMSYGWLTGAVAEITVSEKIYNDQKVFYVRGVGKTVGIADKLYMVNDVYESWFDVNTGLPIRAYADNREGPKYHYVSELLFDHKALKVTNNRKNKTPIISDIKANTFDIIAAFFKLRNNLPNNIKVGERIIVNTFFQDQNWPLVVKYVGTEKITVGDTKVECFKFKPLVQTDGVFADQEALSVWITKDSNRIPVKVEMEFWVGSFTVNLVKFSGLKYPTSLISKK